MPAPRSLCCPWLPRLLSRSRLFSQSNDAAPNRINRWRYTQSAAPRSTLLRGGGASGCSFGQEHQALVRRLRQVFFHLAGEPNFHWSGQPPASRLGRVALLFYAAPRGQVAFPASAAQLNVRPHQQHCAFQRTALPRQARFYPVSRGRFAPRHIWQRRASSAKVGSPSVTRAAESPRIVRCPREESLQFAGLQRQRGTARRQSVSRGTRGPRSGSRAGPALAHQSRSGAEGCVTRCASLRPRPPTLRPATPCLLHQVRPNPSLEPTRTGMALGPRGAGSYHPPRGPSAIPALAPQLKR